MHLKKLNLQKTYFKTSAVELKLCVPSDGFTVSNKTLCTINEQGPFEEFKTSHQFP